MLRYSLVVLALVAASALGKPAGEDSGQEGGGQPTGNYGDAKPGEDGAIMLPQGFVYTELKNPGHPQVFEGTETKVWKFKSDEGSKILIKCEDFRITQTPGCTSSHIEIDTGDSQTVFCEHFDAFKAISTTNQLTVKLVGVELGQAVFSCFVKSTKAPEPKVIEVKLNSPLMFSSPSKPVSFFDKVWVLKAEEGQRIDLTCYINLLEEEEVCHEDVLTINLGDGPQEFCGYKKEMLFSGGNEVTVRLEMGKDPGGLVRCQAEAFIQIVPIVDPVLEERLTIEDSSEHGGKPGAKGTTCKCGWANKRTSRIILGKEAAPNEYPWMVNLRAHFGIGYASCGGSIVTRRHVITAAHCLLNMGGDFRPVKTEDLFVIVGAHNIRNFTPRKTYAEYRVEKYVARPEFRSQFTHDFAVIITKKEIKFSTAVGPICLSPKSIEKENNVITIMGWGKSEKSPFGEGILLKAKTKIIERNRCRIRDHEICTEAKPSATCSGDSGGPLVWLDPETNRYTQLALVSHGHPDCVSSPSVSTDVSYFYEWLQEIIKATYPEEVTCMKQE
uniref:Venom S1 protease with CUB domain 1 n=1 Tax=Ectomocoris sp. TaxID=3104572 RepID=A0AB38ZE41_9HEMI